MTALEAVFLKCICLHGVPGDIGADLLRNEIQSQHGVYVVRIEEVTGPEANRKQKRWILELERELYVKKLKRKSLEINTDEYSGTVEFKEPIECEVPPSWTMPHVPRNQKPTGRPQFNPQGPVVGQATVYQNYDAAGGYTSQMVSAPHKGASEQHFASQPESHREESSREGCGQVDGHSQISQGHGKIDQGQGHVEMGPYKHFLSMIRHDPNTGQYYFYNGMVFVPVTEEYIRQGMAYFEGQQSGHELLSEVIPENDTTKQKAENLDKQNVDTRNPKPTGRSPLNPLGPAVGQATVYQNCNAVGGYTSQMMSAPHKGASEQHFSSQEGSQGPVQMLSYEAFLSMIRQDQNSGQYFLYNGFQFLPVTEQYIQEGMAYFEGQQQVLQKQQQAGHEPPAEVIPENSAYPQESVKSDVKSVLDSCPINKIGENFIRLSSSKVNENPLNSHLWSYTDPMFDGTQTEILVEDIPPGVDEERLEMCFSSRKLKSCTIEDIDIDEDDNNAVIRFLRPEDVKTVLDNLPITIQKKVVSVQIYVPKKLCTVIVRGPEGIMKEENDVTFEMYFENEKKSGGGQISEIDFRSKEKAFYITYEEEYVAKRVVERNDHSIIKKKVTVELFKPSRSTKVTSESTNEGYNTIYERNVAKEEPESQPLKTVKIRGVRRLKSRDSVQWYFENKMKAGGGEIESRFTDEEDDDVMYIKFKDESVAQAVAKRQHTLDGQELVVSLYIPPVPTPSYPNKLLIKGINPKITFSVLDLYLEARTGITLVPGSMTYHIEQEDIVLVTVNGDIDISKLEEAGRSKSLEGSHLRFSPVPLSNCVLVSNISDEVTQDIVSLYFENAKRSNGGSVDKVEMFSTQNFCLVYFADYKDVDNVLSKEHMLQGIQLDVRRYFPCLGRAEGDTVKRRFKGVESVLGNPTFISWDTAVQQCNSNSSHEDQLESESASTELVFDDTQTEILVEDIPDWVDEEILEMLFSSRKLKSCTVVDVDLNDVERNAVIKFKRPEDVKTVMDHLPIKIKKKDLSVQIFVPKKLSTIIVRGPSEIVNEQNEETFHLIFENEKRSGGGIINDINFRSEESAFFITFDDPEVAKRVVKRGDHWIFRKQVKVELWFPRRSTKLPQGNVSNVHDLTFMGSDEVNEEIDKPQSNTVKVRGVRLNDRDSVQLYFETKIKSGGDEIKQIFNDDEDDDFIYIRYKEEAVAREVAERLHTVDGHYLDVSLYFQPITPPSYTNKLLIKGLNPKTLFNVLELYVEAKAGITLVPGSMTYHVDHQDTALVTVDGHVDIHVVCTKLEDACRSKPLDGSILRFSPVPISNGVYVSNISSFYTEDIMTLYFENTPRSNGGPVDKVKMFVKQNYCIVYFKNYKVVDNVLSKIQILDGKTLVVKRYIPCIGKAEDETGGTHV